MRHAQSFIGLVALATVVTGCGTSGAEPSTTSPAAPIASPSEAGPANPSPAADGFTVSSSDFADDAELPPSVYASAFGGQCEGDNSSPHLTWEGAPEGTVAYAITMIDISAGNFVHWTKADIPATVTEVPTGGADALAGVGGRTGNTSGTYFGPCPPTQDHHYVFTVYALDAELGLDPDFQIRELTDALASHTLADASIVGIASPR